MADETDATARRERGKKAKTCRDAVLLCISTAYKLPQVTLVALSEAYTRS